MLKNWLGTFKRGWVIIRDFLDEKTIRMVNRGPLPWVHRFAHFCLMVIRGFTRNRCFMHAAALAYTTLLALIPMLFIAVSISSSVLKQEGGQRINHFITKLLEDMASPAGSTNIAVLTATTGTNGSATIVPDATATDSKPVYSHSATGSETNTEDGAAVNARTAAGREEIVRTVNGFIQNIQRGSLGVTGILVLVFVALSMLNRIETTFNDIWDVKHRRGWVARIFQYWAVISLGPILLTIALNLASGPDLKFTRELLHSIYFLHYFLYEVLPVVILCFTFSLFYFVIPNTKVRWQAAFIGGGVAGLLWSMNNYFSFLYLSRWVTNSRIYGSLAVIPLLMVGLYLSWLILLFGAQVAHAFQNRKIYQQDKQCDNISQRGREFVALRIMECVGHRFQRGAAPATLEELELNLHIPKRLAEQITETLVACRLLIQSNNGEISFAPSRPLETISCHDILLALRAGQGQELFTRDEPARAEVFGEFERILEAEKQAASAVSVLAMVQRSDKRAMDGSVTKALPAVNLT